MGRSVIVGFIVTCTAAAVAGLVAGQQVRTPQRMIVEVSIVATGKNNVPVQDLTVKEITVTDNSKKQKILSFNKLSSGGAAATGKASLRHIVLLDCIYTTFRDVPENRLEILKVVNELSKVDNITFLMLLQDLRTVDPLLLRKFASQRSQGLELSNAKLNAYDWVFSDPLGLYRIFTSAEAFFPPTVPRVHEALEAIASSYHGQSGRKSLLWISQGGRFSYWDGRLLNDADVAVYPIDSRFLSLDDTQMSNTSAMEDLARETGGVAFLGRKDVANCVREALNDTRTVYVLTYAMADPKNDGRFHAVKLETSRKDVSLRARKGYFAPSGN